MTEATVLPGAEPFSAPGGPDGVLVLHGFTGCPQSMRPLAEAFAAAGYAVELPRLPGHGTTVEDMMTTDWADWSAAAEAAYEELAGRCRRVVVAGLSMGGTLTLWLATRHPEIAGIVLVNPAAGSADQGIATMARDLLAAGTTSFAGVGNDIADPDQTELAYTDTPVAPLLSLLDALDALHPELGKVACPTLLLTSPQDHVVDPKSSEEVATEVSGPVRRVVLERSYHVATLDFDRGLIEAEAVAFAREVTAADD